MTQQQTAEWSWRAAIAAAAMVENPAMMQAVGNLVEAAFALTPTLPRTPEVRSALTILAWEQLSAAAKSEAAIPEKPKAA